MDLLNTATQQRILLVDDSPSVLAIMSGILSGYVLSLAYSGEQAIALASLAKSLCQGIHRLGIPHAASRASNHVTASMGLATAIPSMPPQSTWQDLLAQADQALYRAKRAGRNRVETAIFSQD